MTRDNRGAVGEGLALTGRVVTAAAAIMVCVFLSFMLGEDRVIKEFGLSLASAVFLDALVVRCLLLPAMLHLLGPSHLAAPALARPASAARQHRGHDAAPLSPPTAAATAARPHGEPVAAVRRRARAGGRGAEG